jgi:hypothetical protein
MIQIGKAIYNILTGNTEVFNYVGDKVFPLAVPLDTEGKYNSPVLTYERTSNLDYVKGQAARSTSSIDITIYSYDYRETIYVSTAVFDALNLFQGVVNGITIYDLRLTGISETFDGDSFIQVLTFDCKAY